MFEIPTALRWLYIDLNSYFASVEQQTQPRLRNRPLAVVPTSETTATCAIAASYEAKAMGIKTGTMIYEAKKICPYIQIVPARHDKYVEYHHLIMAEIENHLPITKNCSIDEVSCQLLGPQRDYDNAIALAERIKQGILDNVGSQPKTSVGIAPNHFLSKVASNLQKPDGLTVLQGHELLDRLLHLKLRDLPGIGRNMEQRLSDAGISTIQALWNIQPKHARQIWHSVEGEKFWYALRGIEVGDPPETKKHTVSHSHVLSPHMRPHHKARLVARRLTVKAVTRMRRYKFHATFFSLYTRFNLPYSNFKRPKHQTRWQGFVKLPPTQDNFTFLKNLNDLWDQMCREHSNPQVKQISVNLYGLIHQDDMMPDMFEKLNDRNIKQQNKYDRLSKAMDKINKNYGLDTIVVGSLPEPMARYTGSKIAFTRIPEKAEFRE